MISKKVCVSHMNNSLNYYINSEVKNFKSSKSRKQFTHKENIFTYLYIGRAHPSIKNISPIAPPKDKLIKATGNKSPTEALVTPTQLT